MNKENNYTKIYLLIFPSKSILKIGKANDVEARINTLKKWWGEVDYKNSYSLEIHSDEALKIERALHLLLAGYSEHFDEGDGKTEMFNLNCLDIALEHVKLLIADPNNSAKGLTQGIKVTPLKNNSKTTHQIKNRRLKKLITEHKERDRLLDECVERFKKIKKLILFIYAKRYQIDYQYTISNNRLFFRVKGFGDDYDSSYPFDLIRFQCLDSSGHLGINVCTGVIREEAVIQYNIDLIKDDENGLINYLSQELLDILKVLPERSPALNATESIAIIN